MLAAVAEAVPTQAVLVAEVAQVAAELELQSVAELDRQEPMEQLIQVAVEVAAVTTEVLQSEAEQAGRA